ncbi:hypothetical protein A2Y83_02450 [Candidatus Falkowbacteria bacterium RBG_13_39_14]|uniref:YbaK/aminoacyl-tRNA synthetase-associated domain-containing protein n=1 Tax=Candidatus Falkowbacteria bacterium RBG_13_39_14 TaxID=1797985 RepID=A0A1F5S9Q3_9BACT|nr:MAG: hypothetical protein A2Y83_02450 [Candidatus Falkowbacteria bacterium RBG_13_39_14]
MNVEEFLKSKGVDYILHEHPAVYTCGEAEEYNKNIPGIAAKNLFLRDKKGTRYFLVVSPAKKQIDLKKFAQLAEVNKVTFASKETLEGKLGLAAGAVSPFGLLNDTDKEVELFIDEEIYNADIVSFHPNINTATLELSKDMFRKFLEVIERKFKIIGL